MEPGAGRRSNVTSGVKHAITAGQSRRSVARNHLVDMTRTE
ncbi:MAG TPA: hypothetical protein VML50_17345 [Anaeromyxobacter sp.]|nr:hypothetical protein [Anaeromyxobacter sp.]